MMSHVFSRCPVPAARCLLATAIICTGLFLGAANLRAQEAEQGPMAPPPDHHVARVEAEAVPPAPPSLPPQEIIRRFSQKEDEYAASRSRFGFRKSIRIQEFGSAGAPSGEFLRVTDYLPLNDGKISVKAVEKPQSTLQGVFLAPEDLEALDRIPAFPLTTAQLPKYDLRYLGTELVDEIDCYIFQVKPKSVERVHAYFDGIVWVDVKYVEIVKTYGKWITDQGDARVVAQLPFTLFETFRENVDGKYWFPNYSRSDDTLHTKDAEIPMRVVIKWSDFKPAAATPAPVRPAPDSPNS